eukprot:RCo040028
MAPAPAPGAPVPGMGPRGPAMRTGLYKTQICRNWMQFGVCQYGESCAFAHGEIELRPRAAAGQVPMSPPAAAMPSAWGAPYYAPQVGQKRTAYAAGFDAPLERRPKAPRTDLFKTKLCAHFQNTGSCPFGETCAFAHGADELRAAPSV